MHWKLFGDSANQHKLHQALSRSHILESQVLPPD
jgi:hypothetical protein